MRFDGRNQRAEAWLTGHSSDLVTEIIEDQREGIRTALRERMEGGANPRTTALDIVGRVNRQSKRREGGLVGLTSQQMRWVETMRAELSNPERIEGYFERKRRDRRWDKVIRKAVAEGRPLTREQIDKITARYADRLLAYRGEVIARTESLAAFQTAQWDGIWQMIDSGQVQERQVSKIWRSAGDGRVRDSHVTMNGQEQPLMMPFRSPLTGALMQHPHDRSLGAPAAEIIQCRCWLEPKIDFLAAVTGIRP